MAKAPHATETIEVGIRELRNRLSHYLGEVAAGRSIVVTDRGKPVARITGPTEEMSAWDRLVAEGKIIPPEKPWTPAASWHRIKAEGSVSDLVKEQRR
jgi:prevent-host-death family protein